jgi:Protein of unknown function (DUF3102)
MNDVVQMAAEINRLHALAQESAKKAVTYAKQVGELLLKTKAELPHGEFQAWVSANLLVSTRQAQRYMEVAKGRSVPLRKLLSKSDTMSHLPPTPSTSKGIWTDGRWLPEPGFLYALKDDSSTYWLLPADNGGIHVSRLYSGAQMSTEGFYWRYTIFGKVDDPDLDAELYVGTRFAPIDRFCIHDILMSYGIKLETALIKGAVTTDTFARPFGEPAPEHWYWDVVEPNDEFYLALKDAGQVNQRGVPTINSVMIPGSAKVTS